MFCKNNSRHGRENMINKTHLVCKRMERKNIMYFTNKFWYPLHFHWFSNISQNNCCWSVLFCQSRSWYPGDSET